MGDEAELTGLNSGRMKPTEAGEVAWKKLHGDVFRTPDFPNIFACLIGVGAQLFCSIYGMLVFTTVAFHFYNLRPFIFIISLFALATMGWMNGYVTARVLKYFGSVDWCFSAFIAAIVFPTWLITTFAVVDITEWMESSSS